jgi:ABC-type transport system involved in multi-copper enzyme maturation permease subunit
MVDFMNQAKGLTKNPLGIIALFVSLIYGFACLVLSTSISNLNEISERLPLIWFIILFPIIILICFVFLVTKHHGKLYSPSDYGNAESFLKTLEGAKKFEPIQIEIDSNETIGTQNKNQLVKKVEDINLNKGIFSPETKDNVKMLNEFFSYFMETVETKPYNDKFRELSISAQAPEYFILTCSFQKDKLKAENTTSKEVIIIRVTKDNNGVLNMIGIGKNLIETNPIKFGEEVIKHIDNFAEKILKK